MSLLNRAILAIAHPGRLECRHCGTFHAKGEACRCVKAAQAVAGEKAQARLMGDCAHYRAVIKKQQDEKELTAKTHDQAARRLQERCERMLSEQAVRSDRKHNRALATISELRETVAALQLAAQ